MKKMLASAAFAVALAMGSPGEAATLVTSGGTLTGATGVSVGGTLYDVTFEDGQCGTVFGSCTNGAFTFTTEAAAGLAATALLEQVFVDGPSGNFDTNHALTSGCAANSFAYCAALVPFGTGSFDGLTFVVATYALNSAINAEDNSGSFSASTSSRAPPVPTWSGPASSRRIRPLPRYPNPRPGR